MLSTLYVASPMRLNVRDASGAELESELLWLTSYLRDAAFAEANAAARTAALAGNVVPTTAIVAQTLSPDWLVEIEVIAAA